MSCNRKCMVVKLHYEKLNKTAIEVFIARFRFMRIHSSVRALDKREGKFGDN